MKNLMRGMRVSIPLLVLSAPANPHFQRMGPKRALNPLCFTTENTAL